MQEIVLICDLDGTLISNDKLTDIELISLLREFKSKSYLAVREILPLFDITIGVVVSLWL